MRCLAYGVLAVLMLGAWVVELAAARLDPEWENREVTG